MADIVLANGKSTTGTKHSLEIDPEMMTRKGLEDMVQQFKFTVMGPTGKRHAAVKLGRHDSYKIACYLLESLGVDRDDLPEAP